MLQESSRIELKAMLNDKMSKRFQLKIADRISLNQQRIDE